MGTKMQESKVRDVKFEKKAMSAAMRFLALRGYELIDEEWAHEQDVPVIVAKQDDCIVFTEVVARKGKEKGMQQEKADDGMRARAEKLAMDFLSVHDYVEVSLRFDVINLVALAQDRALIRHHINALG